MADTIAPLLLRTAPADNAIGVAVTANLTLGFSETVRAGSGLIKIYKSDGTLFHSVAANDISQVSFDLTGQRVLIDPSISLLAGTGYYVIIEPGAFEDLAGNDYAGLSSPTALNFTTAGSSPPPLADTTAPLLVTTTPADNANNINVKPTLVLTFNEAVKAGSGNIEIRNAPDNTSARIISITDASQVTISGNQITIVLENPLAAGRDFYVLIGSGVILDLANNSFAGISSSTAFNFDTGNLSPPYIIDVSPDNDAVDVPVDANLVITFNEPVVNGWGYFVIHYADGSPSRYIEVHDTSQVTISGNTVTIDPTIDLLSNASCYITAEWSVIRDLAWNYLGGIGPAQFTFTTGMSLDSTAPTLVSTSPADNAVGTSIDPRIDLIFDEGVRAGSGNIELHRYSDGALIESFAVTDTTKVGFLNGGVYIFPHTVLDWETQYYVTLGLGVIQDIAGNDFVGLTASTDLDFTTMADPPLEMVASTPGDGYAGWPIDGNLALVFSESVQPGNGSILVYRLSDNVLIAAIDINDTSQVGFFQQQQRVEIDLDGNFDPYTEYYVLVENGTLRDLDGGNWAGIASATVFNFTTGALVAPPSGGSGSGAGAGGSAGGPDTVAPSLTAISPLDNATNVPTDSNIVLTFNEGVQAGTGTIQIHKVSDGSLVNSIALSDTGQVQFSGATVTVDPSSDLDADTAYYVVLETGALKDGSGNPYAGFSSQAAFNFTTAAPASGLVLTGNSLSNTLIGGAGNDVITGAGGRDTLAGGGGSDKFVYNAVSESTSIGYDAITDFNASADLLDLWFQVTGVDATVASGSLSLRGLDLGLTYAVGAAKLAAHHAVLFTPNAGTLSGSKFLIVDANGVAGYQANADLVMLLGAASSLAGLTAADFI
jgi:methionine-rich copper-binding protein CopC